MHNISQKYSTELFTGIRPTGDLTIANYLGAILPFTKLQNKYKSPTVFIADLHAFTDNEPNFVKNQIYDTLASYIALGINPKKTTIYLQSDIAGELSQLTMLLAKHISVAELLRIPTLKDKIKKGSNPETANVMLFLYPILMASDILINGAKYVPVGQDQLPHIEITRKIAKKFNKKYNKTFIIPKALNIKAINIIALKGTHKMSKSDAQNAILLNDSQESIKKKIQSAETGFAGTINEHIKSFIFIGTSLAKTKSEIKQISDIIEKHKKGELVMSEFKQILIKIVQDFLTEFQYKKRQLIKNPKKMQSILNNGKLIAKQRAAKVLESVYNAMYYNY